jgi:bifunctional DNase/RNase
MIELTIDHVIAKTTETPGPGPRRVVLLREQAGGRVLPIWIGAPEAEALAFGLSGETPPRPLPTTSPCGCSRPPVVAWSA